MNTVMIIAGESSGELYGSLLAKALKRKWPDTYLIGVGGERMREAGVELVSGISDAFGLVEAVSAFRKIRVAFRKTVSALKESRPDVLVLIDYPDFNLKVAKTAKSLGIKILYYVSPQVWAWRKGRVKKIAGLVERMAVVLPFEEDLYRHAGLPCEFVGHPILEEIETVLGTDLREQRDESQKSLKTALGFDAERPVLSLLPGSRPSELGRHLPLMRDVVRKFKSDSRVKGKDYQLCMPLAPNTDEERYRTYLESIREEGVVVRKGESVRVLGASDLAVVASGTATLQTALIEVPMVVIYKLSPITYFLGKRIIKVKHISLVNLLAGRGVVAELIQKRANPEEIMKELRIIMFDEKYRGDMIRHLRAIKGPFLGKRASERVAEVVMEMAGREGLLA
jgi:lipid-A-disaccharide synthase